MLIRNRRQNGRRLGRLRSSYIGSARERNAVRHAPRPAIGCRPSRDRCIDSLPLPLADSTVWRPPPPFHFLRSPPHNAHALPYPAPRPLTASPYAHRYGRPWFAIVDYSSLLSLVVSTRVLFRPVDCRFRRYLLLNE